MLRSPLIQRPSQHLKLGILAVSGGLLFLFLSGVILNQAEASKWKETVSMPSGRVRYILRHQIIGTKMLHGELTAYSWGKDACPTKGRGQTRASSCPCELRFPRCCRSLGRKEDPDTAHSFSIKRLSPHQLISTLKNFYTDASQTLCGKNSSCFFP